MIDQYVLQVVMAKRRNNRPTRVFLDESDEYDPVIQKMAALHLSKLEILQQESNRTIVLKVNSSINLQYIFSIVT